MPSRRAALIPFTALCSLLLATAGLLPPTAAHALGGGAALPTATDTALKATLGTVMADSRVQKATVGAIVVDAASGSTQYSRGADTAITPASNMKVVVGAAALDILGANRRFSTSVYAAAKPSGGTVRQLYLRGFGDPTLQRADLASLAQKVKASGVTAVSGSVIGDGTFFDNDRYNDHWDSRSYNSSYAPQISGLTLAPSSNLKVGTILINSRPGSANGRKAALSVTPALADGYLTLVNKTTTVAAGKSSWISVRRTSGGNTVTVTGSIARNRGLASTSVTVHDPARYAAHVFTRELRAAGVSVRGTAVTGATPTRRVKVAGDTSAPLSVIVRQLLKPSNNGIAEHLIKCLGRRPGTPGTWASGASRVLRWLNGTQTVPGSVRIVDGSGLAHRNKLTTRVIVRLLQYARTKVWFGAFYEALPVAGNANPAIGGTLSSRMIGTAAANNLRAKTGTLSGVTALSGYVTGRNGRLYVFALLGRYTGSSPRPVFDTLGVTLAAWNG